MPQLPSGIHVAVDLAPLTELLETWQLTQTSIECNNLFNDSTLEHFLLANAPKAYGVIRLAALSKPASVGR